MSQYRPTVDALDRLAADICESHRGDDTDAIRRAADNISRRWDKQDLTDP